MLDQARVHHAEVLAPEGRKLSPQGQGKGGAGLRIALSVPVFNRLILFRIQPALTITDQFLIDAKCRHLVKLGYEGTHLSTSRVQWCGSQAMGQRFFWAFKGRTE